MNYSVVLAAAAVLVISHRVQADNISSLDTGAGLYGVNNGGVIVDPNWTVSLLSSTGTPPGGIPNGNAYLVPNNIGFPFGYWLPNDATSSWLTYATPTPVGGDMTGGTFQYQLTFTADNSGTVDVSWLSDNDSMMYVNGNLIGYTPDPYIPNPNDYTTFDQWNSPVAFNVTADTQYTVDLDVYNIPQDNGNPTGGRVEFTGDVNVSQPITGDLPVPEEASMLVNAALLTLPISAHVIRKQRKNRAA